MSLGTRLVRSTMTVLVVALATTGAATGALVARSAVRAQDAALSAALTTYAARGPGNDPLVLDHGAAPVRVWVVAPGDPDIPEKLRRTAIARERPLTFERDGRRVRLTPGHAARGGDGPHVLLAAATPRVSRWGAIAPFVLHYAVVAVAVAAFSWYVLERLVHRGLQPLRAASLDAYAAATRPEPLRRLAAEGPLEVRELLEALDALLARREALAAGQARFAREVAHELRTPVAAMLAEIDVTLRRPREAEDYRAALGETREAVLRLRDLVEGLLALARAEGEVALAERAVVSWVQLLDLACAQEAALLDEAGCTLVRTAEPDTRVRVHAPLVVAAVANLLRNAATYAPGAPVRLVIEVEEGRTRLLVDDSGPGIPDAAREASFGRLVRGPEARRAAPGGLGLGLSLARTIAERHGGRCVLEDAPRFVVGTHAGGGGCRAVLELPLAA